MNPNLAVIEHLVSLTAGTWNPEPPRTLLQRDPSALVPAGSAAGLELVPWNGPVSILLEAVRYRLPALVRTPERGWITVFRTKRGPMAHWLSPMGWQDLDWREVAEEAERNGECWAVRPLASATALLGPPRTEPGAIEEPFQRLLALLREERRALQVVLTFAVGVGLLGLAIPVTVQVLINTVAFGTLTQPLVVLTGLLAMCLTGAAVLRAVKRIAVEHLQRRLFVRVVADLAWRLPRVRLSALDTTHGPELANRFFDVLTVQKAATSLLLDGLSAALQAVVGLLLLAVYHPALLGFDVVLLLSGVFVLAGLGRGATYTAVKESKAKYAVAAWLEQLSTPTVALRDAGGARYARERADALARDYLTARKSHFRVFFRQLSGSLTLQVLANTALLGLGGWLVVERQLTLGQLVAAELIVASVLGGMAKFTDKLETYYDLLAGLDKLGSLGALPLEPVAHRLPPEADFGPATMVIDGIHGGTDGAPAVLHGASLTLGRGERVAIMDGEGRGAAAMAEMVAGLRAPTAGRVMLDGAPLDELELLAVRSQVVLCREREVLPASIAHNVLPGMGDSQPGRVRAALDRVGLLSAVRSFGMDIDTLVTPSGLPLSSPQVARLSLARGLAANPRLLVLDHVLDGLEPACQRELSEMLRDFSFTLLVFTRSPEVAQTCDRVLLLKDGILRPLPPTGAPPSPHFLLTVGEA